jgi:Na+-translocating ferredoxin:NAD+ oxidoreductase RNF subunit RnfB
MDMKNYKLLAERLDALPNGFPATDDGAELRLLAKLFSPEEALLTSKLRMTKETARQIAERTGGEYKEVRRMLKSMAKRGLIKIGKGKGGLAYGLMPFAIGIYEMQWNSIDQEFAELFEDYYQKAFGQAVIIQPQFHRVLPVNETIRKDMEIHPYESAAAVIESSKAWGVVDCLCRKQKALIGDPCDHPLDVCMIMNETPGAFDQSPDIRALTKDEAMATLHRAAEAGLVHSVMNNQEGLWYICNCCTCSCGILRGISKFGIANVIAKSAFVNQVDEDLCVPCEFCVDACQFDAITINEVAVVDENKCIGCGVCVIHCPEGALSMVRRPTEEIKDPPLSEEEWLERRAIERGLDMEVVR